MSGALPSGTGLGSAEAPEPSGLGPTGAIPSAGFTPGPWEIHSGYLVRKCDDDGVCCPIADLRSPYRQRVGLVRGYKEEWHNGHLIAAAPELYEALEALIGQQGICPPEEGCRICKAALAALTKARGEQVQA